MAFSTHLFLFWFLLLTLGVYALLPNRQRNVWLAIASYVFYGWFKPHYCLLLFATTLFNYECGRRIAASGEPRRRKFFVTVSVVGSLGLLGFFKYAGMLSVASHTIWVSRLTLNGTPRPAPGNVLQSLPEDPCQLWSRTLKRSSPHAPRSTTEIW